MPCWQQLFPDVSVSFKLINEQQLQKNSKKTTLTLHVGPDMPHNNQETWPLSGWDVNRWPRCWPTVSLAIGNTKPGGSDWFSRTRTAGEAGWREKQGEGNSQRWRDTQTHQTDTDTHVSVRPQTQWHARTHTRSSTDRFHGRFNCHQHKWNSPIIHAVEASDWIYFIRSRMDFSAW